MLRFGTELLLSQRGVLPEVHKNTPPVLPTLLGDNNIEHVRLSNKPSARALRSSGFPYLEARTNSATLAFPHLDRNHPFPKHSADNNLSLFLVIILLQELIVVAINLNIIRSGLLSRGLVMVAHSDCWRILGLSLFAILVPENITCSIIIDTEQAIHDTEQAIHDIAQHIGTEPSTVTVAEGITGGEVGRTSEAHTNPIDDQWVTAEKAKGEHVDLQQLIAKIPQLRDISTIQARNELKDPRDRNQSRQMTSYHTKGDVADKFLTELINSMKEDFDYFREGLKTYKIPTFSRIPQRLKVIHDQIFWSMKNDFLNSKGMGLGFCISLPGATVAEAKTSEQPLKKNLNLSMNPSDILCILRSSNFQSNPNPQDSSRSDMESKKFQDIVKNISEKFTFLSARTETEAQDIPHLMMDYSISQEVMKSWNRGIIKDLKDIYVKLLYRANSGYRYRDEAYKRLILQTVDLLYKHEMIDVGLFRSFYDTDQMLESAAKNMVWYFILAKRNRVLDFSWNIKFYLDSWYSSHFRNMHEVLDPEQKTKFEYAAHQYLFRLRAWNYVGTRRWILRASAWRKTLFEEDETAKNDITLYKYLEKHPDNDPQKSSEVQDCLIGMIRYLDNDQSLSSNAWKARRVEWRSIYQVLGFIQENYQDVFLEISHLDDQLEDKLRLLRSSSQFLGNLENIRIYLNEYFPSRALLTSDLELKQPRKNTMSCLEELNAIYEYVKLIDKEHNQKHSDIKTGDSLEVYLQREDVNRSVKILKHHINDYQWIFNMGRGKYWFVKCLSLFGNGIFIFSFFILAIFKSK
ncbi:hypothetical protein MJO28_017898 [Puccinia striiformis f. sp. tritici]|nr:hypothetical protein MJO28_017898 [Puccinia striiformis f. sp. tritici]